MTPTVRYPAGPITPHGAYHILHDRIPQVALRSYDDTVVFNMMGGLAIADRTMPERVEIKSLKGLIPPWKKIEQKGATQDGTTFIDALYDPIGVEATVVAKGRNPAYTRKVVRDFIASLDAKQTSELSWTTHELGRWWAPIRWAANPEETVGPINGNRQELALRLQCDSGFWQSYPNIDEFRFSYGTATNADDKFNTDDADDLGTGWTVVLTGAGTGHLSVANGQAETNFVGPRNAVARRVSYTSTTNNQSVEVEIGTLDGGSFAASVFIDIWARMAGSGTAGDSGVRLRIGAATLKVSYFAGGAETVMRQQALTVPPLPGDKFTFIAGVEGNERAFKVMRGGATLMNFIETGTGSPLGSSNRAAGLGSHADSTVLAPGIRRWTVGDNSSGGQSGFVKRINVGDQPFWDRYTCFGPGVFKFGNGPGSSEMVEFGPVLANQVMQIRTDPRKRGVVDLTATPATPQDMTQHEAGLLDFLSFATGNNVNPLLGVIQSIFGIFGAGPETVPPQGNPYSLMKGRFSQPIPAKSPGKPAVPYYVKVEISGGNADSKIIAAGTPLRRNPY